MSCKDYLIGKPEDFYQFVESIKPQDKVGIISHVDLDGLVSAVFLTKILESRKIKINFIDFVNYGKGNIEKSLSSQKLDKLFFTDWNLDSQISDVDFIRKNFDFIVIDHHPTNNELKNWNNFIKTQTPYCSAYTLFDLSKKYINTKKLEWLLYPALIFDYSISDKEILDFAKEKYPLLTKENAFDSVPGKIGMKINSALNYHYLNLKKVYGLVIKKDLKEFSKLNSIIRKENLFWSKKFIKEAEFFPEKNLYFYYANPKYKITQSIVSKLSFENPDKTFIFVSDDLEKRDICRVSGRNQAGQVDVGVIFKKLSKDFENSTLGGHIKAAGGTFLKKDLARFRESVLNRF